MSAAAYIAQTDKVRCAITALHIERRVTPALMSLGDFLGGLRYFGACPTCNAQHVSTHDRGRPLPTAPHLFQCEKCARGAQ